MFIYYYAFAKLEENHLKVLQIEIGNVSGYERTDAHDGVYQNTMDASE